MNVGVIMPSWLGDVCMATPALTMLRSQRTDAHLIAFAHSNTSALLDKHPSIDAIHTLPSKRIIPMARVLRSAKLDEVWLLPGSFRSAAAPWLARVKRRIGYRRDGRGVLLTDGVTQLDRSQCVSTVQWYAHLVQQITGIDATNTPPMRVIVTDEDRSQAGDVLAAAGDRFAVLVPGANRVDKRWPAERFGAVAAAIHASHGLVPVIVGAPSEGDVAAAVMKAARDTPIINAVAMGTSVSALKAIIGAAAVVVTNDTGPRHLALSLAIPSVALFGPTDQRWTAMHVVHERRLVAEPFLPEARVADHCKTTCRIDRIPVSDVVRAVADLLA